MPSSLRIGVVVALLAMIASVRAARADDGFVVIVHPDNAVTSLDRDFVREVFLKKVVEWNSGAAARPIDLASKFPARDRFTQDVIHKTPAQLRAYWNQQIFSGKGVPPPEAESAADVIRYVLENRGAIGYLPAGTDPGHAKVVKVN